MVPSRFRFERHDSHKLWTPEESPILVVHASSKSDIECILLSANNLLDAKLSKKKQDKEDPTCF